EIVRLPDRTCHLPTGLAKENIVCGKRAICNELPRAGHEVALETMAQLMAKTQWRPLALVIVAIAGIAAGYFWYHARNNYEGFLEAARNALARGDRHEADRLLNLVAQSGGEEHVACLRGEAALGEARSLEQRLRDIDKWRQAERGCRMLGDAVGL